MRHEPIRLHPLDCNCDRCPPAYRPIIDPDDISALRKGVVAGSWAVGIVAAAQFGPTIIDWLTS